MEVAMSDPTVLFSAIEQSCQSNPEDDRPDAERIQGIAKTSFLPHDGRIEIDEVPLNEDHGSIQFEPLPSRLQRPLLIETVFRECDRSIIARITPKCKCCPPLNQLSSHSPP